MMNAMKKMIHQGCSNKPLNSAVTKPKTASTSAWFGASSQLGSIYMGIRVSTGRNLDVIQSALIMQKNEIIIQSFEDWLGVALNFLPVPAVPDTQRIQLVFIMKDNPHIHGQLSLPLSSLPHLEKNIERLGQVMKIQWKTIPVMLQLSNIELPVNQLKKLETGGLYLLNESFATEWFSEVRLEADASLRYRVKISTDGEMKVTQQNKNWNSAELLSSSRVRVVVDTPIRLPADHFMTWIEPSAINLQDTLIRSSVSLILNGETIATGKLMPLSHGYAVMLNHCRRFV